MATKKKALLKKAAKVKPIETIFILPDGTVFPADTPLDGNALKHPPKVFWQAVDMTKVYQIVLANPPAPCPFKNGLGPFPTDADDGTTQALTVDSKKCANGKYKYSVEELSGARKIVLSGGGIIIDS
jgi:hypothetical protein